MTMHIGLVGGGNITETHARAARAIRGVVISAIHGSNAEKVARLCREHGGTPYQDVGVFLEHRPMDVGDSWESVRFARGAGNCGGAARAARADGKADRDCGRSERTR